MLTLPDSDIPTVCLIHDQEAVVVVKRTDNYAHVKCSVEGCYWHTEVSRSNPIGTSEGE